MSHGENVKHGVEGDMLNHGFNLSRSGRTVNCENNVLVTAIKVP